MSVTSPADKKVMRIALVGIRPADQVMLKGYLRVLLRLDTDLEWVSANSPVVDLFMVSQEFQNADSVQRILGKHHSQNVLYVTRSPVDMGSLTDNTLTLPLKELEQLSQWLSTHIPLLNDNENLTPRLSQPEMVAPTKTVLSTDQSTNNGRQTLDEIIAQRASNPARSPASAPVSPTSQASVNNITPTTSPNTETDSPVMALFKTAEQLQKHQAGVVSLMQGDNVVAYLAPDRQRVWVVNPNSDIGQGWQLSMTTSQPPITQQTGEDMVQWLWTQGYAMPTDLLSQLVPHDVAYQLTSWVKPDDTAMRHDILKIQCMLEVRAATLDEIIQTAEVSREVAMRTLGGLMMAGLMPASVYARLIAHARQITSRPVATSATASPTSNSSVLDNLPINTPPVRSIPQPTASPTPTPAAPAAQPTEMKGFLSRLRQKLGL